MKILSKEIKKADIKKMISAAHCVHPFAVSSPPKPPITTDCFPAI